MVHPERITATLMYPDTDKKLFLTFEGRATEYCVVLTNEEAKKLQARLKTLFGDNPDNRTIQFGDKMPMS